MARLSRLFSRKDAGPPAPDQASTKSQKRVADITAASASSPLPPAPQADVSVSHPHGIADDGPQSRVPVAQLDSDCEPREQGAPARRHHWADLRTPQQADAALKVRRHPKAGSPLAVELTAQQAQRRWHCSGTVTWNTTSPSQSAAPQPQSLRPRILRSGDGQKQAFTRVAIRSAAGNTTAATRILLKRQAKTSGHHHCYVQPETSCTAGAPRPEGSRREPGCGGAAGAVRGRGARVERRPRVPAPGEPPSGTPVA